MLRIASKLIVSMAIGFSVAAVAITYGSFAVNAAASFAPMESPALVKATQAVCENLGKTRFVSGCHVNDQASSVSFTLNVTSDKADKLCAGASKELAGMVPSLVREGWNVRIFSPYDTQRAMSTCGIG